MERPVTEADLTFDHVPETEQSFENALAKARDGDRVAVDDAIELLTTGTDSDGIDRQRKERVLEAADRRRAERVGEEVTFIANLNNNVTTACNVGCLFCNFKDAAHTFERSTDYRQRRRIDPDDPPFGPQLGPQADGTPLLE